MTEKIGLWIDMDHPYITHESSYIETLWWIIREFSKKKYLYEDYKVVPWCTRCGTALSSHELAQGYEKITEESVYVKFPTDKEGEYFLVWTTTPWTLPGNVALAVHPAVDYVYAEANGTTFILAESRLSVLPAEHNILKKIKGAELVGREYHALFPDDSQRHPKIIAADFVSTGEGTGIVHIAPAFGDDDFHLSKKHGLPTVITTDEQGNMQTPGKPWHETFFKKADPLIMNHLDGRGLLFKSERYEHDYPFCWRCRNPLMYLARKTWWVSVNKVRKELIKNNETIDWHPHYIKHGRFGGWLKEEKDWAFSRERYWGTPLPVWKCEKCGALETVGSLEDLDTLRFPQKGRVFLMRHGEAAHNVRNVVSVSLLNQDTEGFQLTARGRRQVQSQAKRLKHNIDVILSSPLQRAKDTAEIVSSIIKAPVIVDARLYDINSGDFVGRDLKEFKKLYPFKKHFHESPPGGESIRDVRKRMMNALFDLLKKHEGKTMLIVSHGDPLWILDAAMQGLREEDYPAWWYPKTSEIRELHLRNWPYNEEGELDLHKPYIDGILLSCRQCSNDMRRVSEVVDAWFDSGSMPYAQAHFPFAQKGKPDFSKIDYPADYITEAVDQTRGWFYNLLAVATLLGRKAPFRAVISLGHVLDKEGKKMSKSLGNIVDPMALIETYGADSVRWYFYTINQPWDRKYFTEEDVKQARRNFSDILLNVLHFYQTYAQRSFVPKRIRRITRPKHVLDRWVLLRFDHVIRNMTTHIESYEIVHAARALQDFVGADVSRWYVRRSRERIKNSESKVVSVLLKDVLIRLAVISAPFTPFLAEHIYKEVGGPKESVHLEDWPSYKKGKKSVRAAVLLKDMDQVRKIVNIALEARAKANIKIRQPLKALAIKNERLMKSKDAKGLLELIKEEVNVKEVTFDAALKSEILLDTALTDELRDEGDARELIRRVQQLRKEANLKPQDAIKLLIGPEEKFKKHQKTILQKTNAKRILWSEKDELEILP